MPENWFRPRKTYATLSDMFWRSDRPSNQQTAILSFYVFILPIFHCAGNSARQVLCDLIQVAINTTALLGRQLYIDEKIVFKKERKQ